MVEYFKLDKTVVQGTTYELPNDKFYIVKKIGTDASSATHLKIDGIDMGDLISDVAPLHKTSSNKLGPLDLGELFYVVPPNKKFSVEGASGAKMRLVGLIGVLAPGEALPANYASRFTDQGNHYLTYQSGSVTLAAAAADWAAGDEKTMLELTPKTIEKYGFNRAAMAKIENSASAIANGQAGVIFYLDGRPLDILTSDPGMKGIDVLDMPYPPADANEEDPLILGDTKIEVQGDHTFKATIMNVSGAAITASSSVAMTASFAAVVEYIKS